MVFWTIPKKLATISVILNKLLDNCELNLSNEFSLKRLLANTFFPMESFWNVLFHT